MPKFNLTAQVVREITDTVSLSVEAETAAHAFAIAEKVLEKFPKEAHTEEGVTYCYIEDRQMGEPTVIDVEEKQPD